LAELAPESSVRRDRREVIGEWWDGMMVARHLTAAQGRPRKKLRPLVSAPKG